MTSPRAARPAAVLIGPPGAGKSAIGPLLAERLGTSFHDTDAEIEATAGQPVSDIFIEQGEQVFRELERAAAARALREQAEVGGVVAEAMAALVLADAAIEKFGGDNVVETRRNLTGYLETLAIR